MLLQITYASWNAPIRGYILSICNMQDVSELSYFLSLIITVTNTECFLVVKMWEARYIKYVVS